MSRFVCQAVYGGNESSPLQESMLYTKVGLVGEEEDARTLYLTR
jgi:hypothetical protein